jgi:hypothetical protein
MFRFFGGVPRLIVPDNLKSGVHKASFYDPELNRSYGMMASHCGVGVLPARPRKPRDKAKVEAGVRFAQSYILGRLRHQTFFSLAEANQAIAAVLEPLDGKVMRRLGLSRWQLFDTVDRPALAPLPGDDYEFAEWRLARVSLDYHVEFDSFRHAASVEDVDYRAARGLDRAMFLKLAACDWIRARHNLLITGPCGLGKSWLACALGHKACREDLSVAYHRVPVCSPPWRSPAASVATPACCAR